MTTPATNDSGYQPGALVRTRDREWITLSAPAPGWLKLRPLAGGEQDSQTICLALENVSSAIFQVPDSSSKATQDGARLLSEALRLSLRRGAGPFRSAAHIAIEPRAYQLVPLLMALRLPVVRLLIADDVGVGKTVEAALIIRELLDRGEVEKFSVLCPPHLVEQWTGELRSKFDVDAVAVTASTATRLERSLPASQTIFDAFPFTVVSLDYIKADRRRESFARSCPSLVVVDEAHACVGVEGGRQQRFELLTRLAEDTNRHVVLLTATPHSGNESAFDRLLTLLDQSFAGERLENDLFRRRLARHFVQRRRLDVTQGEWQEQRRNPRLSRTQEHRTYLLSSRSASGISRFRGELLCRDSRGSGSCKTESAARVMGNARSDAVCRFIDGRRPQRSSQSRKDAGGNARRSTSR